MRKSSQFNVPYGESALQLPKHLREPFDELRNSFQDFHASLESLLLDSSPGSAVVRASSFSESGSQDT